MNVLKSFLKVTAVLAVLALGAGSAWAITLDFTPPGQLRHVGQGAQVGVQAHNPWSTHVGSFDLLVHYDPLIVSLDSVVFGDSLGGSLGLSISGADPALGFWTIFEISMLSDLTELQNGSDLTLFTMYFTALHPGVSPLRFTGNIGDPVQYLGDSDGYTIPLTESEIGLGSITVLAQDNVVPEPATLLLLGPGILGLWFWRRQRPC